MERTPLAIVPSFAPSTDAVISSIAIFLGAGLLQLVRCVARGGVGKKTLLARVALGLCAGCLAVLAAELLLRAGGWRELWPGPIWERTVSRALVGAFAGLLLLHVGLYVHGLVWFRPAPYLGGHLAGALAGFTLALVTAYRCSSDLGRFAPLDETFSGIAIRALVGALLGSLLAVAAVGVARCRRSPDSDTPQARTGRSWLQFTVAGILWFVFLASGALGLLAWDHGQLKQSNIRQLVELATERSLARPRGSDEARVKQLVVTIRRLGAVAETGVSLLESLDTKPHHMDDDIAWWGQYTWEAHFVDKFGLANLRRLPVGMVERELRSHLEPMRIRPRQLRVFEELGPEIVPPLTQLLRHHSDAAVRMLAEEVLYMPTRSGGAPIATDPAPLLEALVQDPDVAVRRKAAMLLALWGPQDAAVTPRLVEALSDGDSKVRGLAAFALSRTSPNAQVALKGLVAALNDEILRVRAQAAWAIAKIDPTQFPLAEPVLIELLRSHSESLRVDAICTLRQFGPQANSAIPAVRKSLERSRGFERILAYSALSEIEGNSNAKPRPRDDPA